MTDRPYTDDDLRAEAARQHATLTEDPDFMGVGERMEDSTVTSTKDGTTPLTWAKLLVPEGDTYEAFDEPQRAIHKLISRAADTSRWAVDLGADGLEPHERTLTSGGEQTGFRVHFAFNPGLTDSQRNAVINYIAHLTSDCRDCPTPSDADPRTVLSDLAGRWEQMADQGDTAIGHFEGPAAATLDAEVGERGRVYRKAAADVREALRTGRIPRDLLTPAEVDALPDDTA